MSYGSFRRRVSADITTALLPPSDNMDSSPTLAENGINRDAISYRSHEIMVPKERFQQVKKMIWGPFLILAYLTGQLIPVDVTQVNTVQKMLHFIPAIISGLILVARAIYMFILMMSATSLSINWTYTNVLFFMALHAFVSSLILMKFKFINFINKTTQLLITATRNEFTIPSSYRAPRWIRAAFSFSIMIAGSAVYCVDNYMLYDEFVVKPDSKGFTNDTEVFRKSMFQKRALLPLDTVIIMWGAIISASALLMYASANTAMISEYGTFNRKLRKLIDNKQILKYEVAKEVEYQTIDFLELANHITHSSADLISVTFMMALFMQICSQFAFKAFSEYLKFGFATFIVWTIVSVVMLVLSVLRPATLYTMSRDTIDMLYLDHGIWRECYDERIREIVRDTIDRIEKIDYANKTLTSAKSASGLFNIIMIIIPFFVIILSAYKSAPVNL